MQTKFKGFEVTDFAALKAAFPKLVETVEAVKSADVRKLLELGVTVPGVTVTTPEPTEAREPERGVLPKDAPTAVTLDCVGTEGGKASVEQVIPAFYNKAKKGE